MSKLVIEEGGILGKSVCMTDDMNELKLRQYDAQDRLVWHLATRDTKGGPTNPCQYGKINVKTMMIKVTKGPIMHDWLSRWLNGESVGLSRRRCGFKSASGQNQRNNFLGQSQSSGTERTLIWSV